MLLRYKVFLLTVLLGTIYALYLCFFTNDRIKITDVCKSPRILAVRQMGNLGNSIWEYMSLYAVSKMYSDYNINPYIQKEMKDKLDAVFHRITISYREDLEEIMNTSLVIPVDKPLDLPNLNCDCISNWLLGNYSARYEEVIQFSAEIRKELSFKRNLVEDAMDQLSNIRKRFRLDGRNVTFVGMHYRGTDYINHLQSIYGSEFKGPPDYQYYVRAMEYFKSIYSNVIFILISIDHNWLRRNKGLIERNNSVTVNPHQGDPIKDLVLLSHCNHSIINYGTFGATSAFLNEGTTFVYNLELPLDHRGQTIAMGMAGILKNWHILL